MDGGFGMFGGSNHQDIFEAFHGFLSHYWSQDRNPMGNNPIQWALQNADKIPAPQDVFKQMIQAGAEKGVDQSQLAPIQSIFDSMGWKM